jgi:hypothetical protein
MIFITFLNYEDTSKKTKTHRLIEPPPFAFSYLIAKTPKWEISKAIKGYLVVFESISHRHRKQNRELEKESESERREEDQKPRKTKVECMPTVGEIN